MVACVKPVYCLIVLLQIKIFQDVRKPEKLTEHAGLHYHLAAIVEAEHFINVYEDPTANADFDKDKEDRYNKNLHVLKSIVPASNYMFKVNNRIIRI